MAELEESRGKISASSGSPTFKIALGVFGALGFVQLMAVGVAYTLRAGQVKEVVKYKESPVVVLRETVHLEPEKEVRPVVKTRDVASIVKRVFPNGIGSVASKEEVTGIVEGGEIHIKPASASYGYVINHPRVGKLLGRAKDAYAMGDMGAAVMLVEEARELDQGEAAVVDMLAQISEGMGALNKARGLYMTVFQMGASKGPYYKRAASKLEKGVGRKFEEGAYMQLGTFNIARSDSARNTKVVIPIRSREGEFIVGEQVEVQVHFYDKVSGEKIEPAAKNASIISTWQNQKVDWNERSEEILEVSYKIPVVDEVQQHLYGVRKYYGQVVELYYKGEIQDVVAHPRTLHKRHAEQNRPEREDVGPFEFLENLNESYPLLPQKPR